MYSERASHTLTPGGMTIMLVQTIKQRPPRETKCSLYDSQHRNATSLELSDTHAAFNILHEQGTPTVNKAGLIYYLLLCQICRVFTDNCGKVMGNNAAVYQVI